MANAKIRIHAMEAGVKLYQVAEELGIWDTAFSRKLRKELDDEETAHIMAIIDRLAIERDTTTDSAATARP